MPHMSERFDRLRALRASEPAAVAEAAAARLRRETLLTDGRLLLIAADHPARGALRVGDREQAMGDRYELLERLCLALACPGVDGILATPDIVDDLLLLGALDGKVVAGSINRGGLNNSAFELDDRPTAYSPASLVRDRHDFGKVLLRIDPSDMGTVGTLATVSRVVSESATLRLPIMVEPFMSTRVGGRVVNELTAEAMVSAVSIAAGLGDTSAYTWLKLPVVADMERVMAATTLPTLLLGGDPDGGVDELYRAWEAALALPGVRGIVAGRKLLYPDDGDVVRAVRTAAAIVHPAAAARPSARPGRTITAPGLGIAPSAAVAP